MENKKKRLGKHKKEIAPEPILKAPPPTPSMPLKQRAGSAPDIRILDMRKEKFYCIGPHERDFVYAFSCCKPSQEFEGKRSSSEPIMTSGHWKGGEWITFGIPCTSNILHSVRQRLMNL